MPAEARRNLLVMAAVVLMVAAEVARPVATASAAASFFTTQAKKCMTERFETLSPASQRLCIALDTLVEMADVMDEKTVEEALRRVGLDEEFLAGKKLLEKNGVMDPSVKRDDKYEHMFMRFGRKRRAVTA
ncbi:unnamed protein product [Notodromas monacha]|uniref:Uncharacterized protein n=1 Tax=Notodromas monacha TaxID=399045 RepID=A0A7R9BNF6_9CRUS|nr:unnamed protein product [Notodromas monacha]CAG0918735.1 unnamed protein product [Notodromas monacha]